MPLILDGSLESEAIPGHTAHWWCDAHVILVLWRLWQKYCQEFEASLLHTTRPCLKNTLPPKKKSTLLYSCASYNCSPWEVAAEAPEFKVTLALGGMRLA